MTTYFIVPCGAAKTDAAVAARDLYTGSAFRHVLAAAEAEAAATTRDLGTPAVVLILSALHGLLTLDQVVAPYNVKMGDADAIDADGIADTAADLGIEYGAEVYAMLPKAYRAALVEALDADDILVHDVYEAAPGIGYQRGVASSLNRSHDMVAA